MNIGIIGDVHGNYNALKSVIDDIKQSKPIIWIKANKPYYKHGRTTGTCREHAKTEFEDWLWLTAEIIRMITKIQLPIVPKQTYQRMWNKMEETRRKSNDVINRNEDLV